MWTNFFKEDDFQKGMDETVLPWLKENLVEGTFEGEKGISIHYSMIHHPEEKAAVVIFHGYCEFFGKYHEMAYYLYQNGYSVYCIEQRGHGRSGRENHNPSAIHVVDFQDYVRDQKTFIDNVVKKNSGDVPLYLLAHSMGGLVGTRFLEDYPEVFDKAVLSSPMIQINFGKVPYFAAVLMGIWFSLTKNLEAYVPGGHDFKPVSDFEHSSQLSEARYNYMFKQRLDNKAFQTSGATMGWTWTSMKAVKKSKKNLNRIKTPVLLCQAGLDDKVDNRGQDYFIAHRPDVRFEKFPKSKHEIFNAATEERERYYRTVLSFFEE